MLIILIPHMKSPTMVLVDDIFCLLHTLNFGKVFFCLGVCIIPTKECFFETFGSPSKLCLYQLSEVPVSYVHIWSPNKGCLRYCYQGPIVCQLDVSDYHTQPYLQWILSLISSKNKSISPMKKRVVSKTEIVKDHLVWVIVSTSRFISKMFHYFKHSAV